MPFNGLELNNCYKIVNKIGENNVSTVWKASGIFSPLDFVIKFLKKQNQDYREEELVRFENEIMGIYKIHHPNINKIFEIDTYDNHTFVVMEYIEGITLLEYLENGKKLNYNDIINIIYKICNGLEVAHRNGSIHKNLNPQNILLILKGDKIEEVKITNFGFSEIIDLYRNNSEEEIINIYSYMPPESCPICNLMMDERSDIYSLGVIFYYLLTKKLPFTAKDIDSLYRKIISEEPCAPSKLSKYKFNEVIDKIVLKLLSKEKKNRYQSAEGLVTDIEMLMRKESDFQLGLEDTSFNTYFESDIIIRGNELNKLKNLYKDISISKGNACLLTGTNGVGKTNLLNSFSTYVMANNGIFLQANCKSNKIKMPYQIFYDLLYNYLDYYQKLNLEEQDKIVNRIIKECNNNLSGILDQFDFLSEIFPDYKEDKNVDFKNIFIDFLCSLSSEDKPLVLIIKNIQWIDKDSLIIMDNFLAKIESKSILLIMSYVENKNECFDLLSEIFNEKVINCIQLYPLNKDLTKKLLLNILGDNIKILSDKIVDFIFNMSEGNPYYIIEILRLLVNKEVVYPIIDSWEADSERLERTKWKNKDEVILDKIQVLRNQELTILTYASLLDIYFNADLLFKLCKLNKTDLVISIDYMVKQDILKMISTRNGNKYFVDEITKSILIKKMDIKKREEIHHEIAVLLEKDYLNSKDKNLHYLITHHYVMSKEKEKEKSLEYLYRSGLLSMDTHAYHGAYVFFNEAKEFMEKYNIINDDIKKDIKLNLNKILKKIE